METGCCPASPPVGSVAPALAPGSSVRLRLRSGERLVLDAAFPSSSCLRGSRDGGFGGRRAKAKPDNSSRERVPCDPYELGRRVSNWFPG